MAVLVRTRRLSNPASRRRKRNYGTREGRSWSSYKPSASKKKKKNPGRLSLKQKLHFGTARQRAAARLALRRPNAGRFSTRKTKKALKKTYGYKDTRVVTGMYKKHSSATRQARKKRRKNIGEIVSISLAGLNPGKRRKNTSMAKHHRRLKNTKEAKAARRRYRRARAGNPGRRRNYSHRRRHNTARRNPSVRRNRGRRRNPVYAMRRINRGRRRNPIMGITSGTIGKALGVIGGALASKYITQLALGGNNTGMMGYGGNLVASIALGWGAGKLTKSQDFGVMVTVGGLAALVLRVLSDNTSIGQYVNLSLAGVGKGGDTGLGIIQDSSFPVPQVAQPGSMTSFITPAATRSYVSGAISAAGAQAAQMSAAGSGKGMGRMQGRMARRAIM